MNWPRGKESTEVRKSQIKGKESENSYQELKRSQGDRHTVNLLSFDWGRRPCQSKYLETVSVCLCVPVPLWSLQFLVRVFTFLSLNLWQYMNCYVTNSKPLFCHKFKIHVFRMPFLHNFYNCILWYQILAFFPPVNSVSWWQAAFEWGIV